MASAKLEPLAHVIKPKEIEKASKYPRMISDVFNGFYLCERNAKVEKRKTQKRLSQD